jgi:hypothetical protein
MKFAVDLVRDSTEIAYGIQLRLREQARIAFENLLFDGVMHPNFALKFRVLLEEVGSVSGIVCPD